MFFKRFLNLSFLLVVGAVVLLNLGCVKTVTFEGSAMKPAIENGDKILFTTELRDLRRGDIILFKYPKDERRVYVKRIVGLPNEKIAIRNGKVFVNSEEIDEPYLDQTYNKYSSDFVKKIPANDYFVMGDNRDNSSDSRYWGTLKKELVLGKYWMTYGEAEE